jgi:hypothetical protein
VKRINLFVKGNVDVHDSLHSCIIGGVLQWNGINEVVRKQYPDTLIRLKHETFTRSDALLAAAGAVPAALAARSFRLGAYPLGSQFNQAVFETDCDAIVFSIQADAFSQLFRHRGSGTLFYIHDWPAQDQDDQDWLNTHFERTGLLSATESMANFERIIARIRGRTDAPIMIYNVSSVMPGETVHCLLGLGETFSTRMRRFNLGLAELSGKTGVSIIDVDNLMARHGADRMQLSGLHLTAAGYALVAGQVAAVLEDLGLLERPVH